jgi:Fe-S-cluster containining protein
MQTDKFLNIATDEAARTRNDLKKNQPDHALINFYARHDQVVAAILKNSKTTIACQAGCSYCCYLKVEVKPLEIIAITQYVEKKFHAKEIEAVIKQAKKNLAEFKHLDYTTQVATNQACPFLFNNNCSIYEVRPSKCRNNHATDAVLCKSCFDNPTDNSIPSSYYKPLHLAVNGLVRGFESVLDEKGYDTTAYDINEAFIAAVENPKFKKRFFKSKKTIMT